MTLGHTRARRAPRRYRRGFTLIEVLITILIMGVGLLGFALLQTMNLRFAQSANYRTQATNLAYELLDKMRMNRRFAVQYENASFSGGAATTACPRDIGPVDIAQNVLRWQCEVRSTLGEGSSAVVTFTPADGLATVALTWGDERWNDVNRDGTVSASESNRTFFVSTRL
jgi:type IV pilus assembly protein PilV